jgi:hypothetical protein
MFPLLFSPAPLARCNLAHLGIADDPVSILQGALGADIYPDMIVPHSRRVLDALHQEQHLGGLDSDIHLYPYSLIPRCHLRKYLDELDGVDGLDWPTQMRVALLAMAALHTRVAVHYSDDAAIPIASASKSGGSGYGDLKHLGTEEVQLVRLQFRDIRYPVIRTLDDVLRLRDDPNLASYRDVIAYYANELRSSQPSEQSTVLKMFRSDVQLALTSVRATKKWSRLGDIVFWTSIPLAVAGTLVGLPLSDLVAIPVTGAAKYMSSRTHRQHRWILLGA